PTNGQYLGSFGTGYLVNPFGLTVSGDTAYVSTITAAFGTYFSKVDKFNWSTGAFLGSLFSSLPYEITDLTIYGNSLLASDFGDGIGGNSMRTFDLTSGAMIGTADLPNNIGNYRITTLGNQAFVDASQNGNGFYRFDLNPNGTASSGYTHFGSHVEV